MCYEVLEGNYLCCLRPHVLLASYTAKSVFQILIRNHIITVRWLNNERPLTMNNDWSMLHLKVQDKATGRLLPARFHIKRKGGSAYTPPSDETTTGRRIPQVITAEVFNKNLDLCQSVDIRSSHLTSGEGTFPVPAGQLTIYIARGYEYVPFTMTFVAKAGKETHLECELSTIENMSGSGWYSGDMHIHFTRHSKRDDSILAHLMAAEGLFAVNNMVYKHDGKIQAHQRTMGHRNTHYKLSHHHQVISGGEEFRDNDMYGHMIAAGIKKRIEPVSVGERLGRRENYPLFSQVCDWTHEQHGIAGWAHGAAHIKLHESLPIEAALRKLDFIEKLATIPRQIRLNFLPLNAQVGQHVMYKIYCFTVFH